MARRANAKQHPLMWVGIILMIVLIIGGAFMVLNKSSEPYRATQNLDVNQYMENANSLRGNTYKLEAVIQNSLAWSPAKGRLFSVEVETGGSKELLPVLIPPELNHINVQKGQKFFFKVEIIKEGIILVREMSKA